MDTSGCQKTRYCRVTYHLSGGTGTAIIVAAKVLEVFLGTVNGIHDVGDALLLPFRLLVCRRVCF